MRPRDDGRPIFLDLADEIADEILAGIYPEGSQVPSTNELSAHYRINPATAAKALNRLVDAGVLHKRRGLGMFVSDGAPAALRAVRKGSFAADYIRPLLREANRLSLSVNEIIELIRKEES